MRQMMLGGILLTMQLAGCGFQLRGQAELPPELAVVHIHSVQGIGMPPGVLSRRLPTVLVGSGVAVVRDPAQATATITILNESGGRRAVAADRFDIKREYFLAYNAVYQVTLANGKTLIPAEAITANRRLLFDENRVLGFEAAQESLVDSMVDELAWQIIRRLQAIKS